MLKDRLKELRISKNLTQKELAEKVYVSRSSIAKWETGGGFPKDDSIKILAEFFNVTEEFLIDTQSKDEQINYSNKNKKIFFISSILCIVIPIILFALSNIKIFVFDTNNIDGAYILKNTHPKSIMKFIGIHIIYSYILYFTTFIFSLLCMCSMVNLDVKKVYRLNFCLIICCIIAFILTFVFATINAYEAGWIFRF